MPGAAPSGPAHLAARPSRMKAVYLSACAVLATCCASVNAPAVVGLMELSAGRVSGFSHSRLRLKRASVCRQPAGGVSGVAPRAADCRQDSSRGTELARVLCVLAARPQL